MQQLEFNLGSVGASADASDLDDPERRRARRQRVVKAALIAFHTDNCCLNCHILDLSETGAKLLPADIAQCPDQFILRPKQGPSRQCEVVWRSSTMVGVRFV